MDQRGSVYSSVFYVIYSILFRVNCIDFSDSRGFAWIFAWAIRNFGIRGTDREDVRQIFWTHIPNFFPFSLLLRMHIETLLNSMVDKVPIPFLLCSLRRPFRSRRASPKSNLSDYWFAPLTRFQSRRDFDQRTAIYYELANNLPRFPFREIHNTIHNLENWIISLSIINHSRI